MQTIIEKMGITYREEGDYLLAKLESPESRRLVLGSVAASTFATNQMKWVQRTNNLRNRTEEIVYQKLIYE